MGKVSKRQKKRCVSSIKRNNRLMNKLQKKGLYNREQKMKEKKARRKERLKLHYESLKEIQQCEKAKEPERELTGEEMMEMMDKDDLNSFNDYYSKNNYGMEDDSVIEKEGLAYKKGETTAYKEGKVVKPLLPVLTDEGWEYREGLVSTKHKELTLDEYDRKKEDSDSGIFYNAEEVKDPIDFLLVPEKMKYQGKTKKTVAQIWAEQKRKLHTKKVEMACLALKVVEQRRNEVSGLRALIKMLKQTDPKSEVTLRKYITMTLLQVFHDQIPGYRMRTEKPNHIMKKNNYSILTHEMDFAVCYRVYLRCLEDVLEEGKADPTNAGLQSLSEMTLYCLGDLLVMHPHFNYSVNIVQSLVMHLTHRNNKMRCLAYDALSKMMNVDMHNYLALEMVRRIYKLMQRLKYRVRGETLRVFFALKLNNMKNADSLLEEEKMGEKTLVQKEKLIEKLSKKIHHKSSRKQKKANKKIAKVREQMAEINLTKLQNTKNARQTEILQKVFGIYFHILKKKPKSALMPVVLEGLAKFSHLINIEFFSDILMIMNGFLEAGTLGKRESLHCIQTVFTILSGQGEALNIDPQKFYTQFYKLLLDLQPQELFKNLDTHLEIVEQMLIIRRMKVSVAKVLSFAKRIATVSLTLPHQGALPLLISLKKLFTAFSCTEALLETDSEGAGVFHPEIPDPEHTNAASATVWELILSQKHYHEHVQVLSKSILSGVPSLEVRAVHDLIKMPIKNLLEDHDISKLKFNPAIPEPNAHLPSKKKLKKQVFMRDSIVLDDIKLQSTIDRVLAAEDDRDEPSKKRLKTAQRGEEEDSWCKTKSLDFCQSLEVQESGESSTFNVDKIENLLSYFVVQ